MRLLYAATAALLAAAAFAADPIPKSDGTVPKKASFVFPQVTPKTDPPAPPPAPGAMPLLAADTLYVVPSDEPFLLFDSPRGIVSITRESGPVKIRGKFLDGSGKIETRTYNAKHIAIVEGVGKGRVELISVPQGIADEGGAARMLVDVNQAPQPPPVDPVKPVEPVVVKSFRVLLVYESADTMSAANNSILYGKAVEDFLNANCTGGKQGWARREKDATGTYDSDRQAVWDAVKNEFAAPKNTKTPALVIQVNDKITIEPFGPTAAGTVAILRKYLEGK